MQKFLLGCAAVLASAGAAFATDLPARTPAPIYKAAPAYSWSGLYGGIHGGYGLGENEISDNVPPLAGKFKPTGGFGGIQIGYNSQFSQHWMIGAQIDLSVGSISDNFSVGTATGKINFDSFGTARTRFGYVQDRSLLYVTGGAIWLRDKYTASDPAGGFTDSTQYHVGWVWGGGIEYAFDARWSMSLEYLYAPLDRSWDISGAGDIRRWDANFSIVRAGLNYRFGDAGAPAGYLPVKAAAPRSSWSGSYIGLHGGYGWSTLDKFDGFVPLTAILHPEGAYGGFQAGYNWLYAPNALLGIEIDSSFGDLKQTASGGGVTATGKIEDLGTARLRLGHLMTPDTLVYVTGGAAYAREKSTDTFGAGDTTRADHLGWTIGGGAEYKFAPEWTLKAEYLYADLGRFTDSDLTNATKKSDMTLGTVRVGLNYQGSILERLFGGR